MRKLAQVPLSAQVHRQFSSSSILSSRFSSLALAEEEDPLYYDLEDEGFSQNPQQYPPSNAPASPIYVAATQQHVGKTTVSLALMSGLQKRFSSPGYIKPVGQHSRQVTLTTEVDKDVAVMRDYYQLNHLPWESMSPVLVAKGYTKNYVNGLVCQDYHQSLIQRAYEDIAGRSDVVLVEGTGHVGVGKLDTLRGSLSLSCFVCSRILLKSFLSILLHRKHCWSKQRPSGPMVER
jgi:hypothetical protein